MVKKEIIETNQGILKLHKGYPNPKYATDRELFLLSGDATQGKINQIIPEPGVHFPSKRKDLTESDFFLTLFHFNDVHGHLVRFTTRGEEPVFTRMAYQIAEKQRKVKDDPYRAVLTLSAGDDCIGTVFDELMDMPIDGNPIHASYQLYSAAGVDLSVLGNHDFDLGVNVLEKSIRSDANFPILAANMKDCSGLSDLIYPAAIMVVKGVRVGIIGLVTAAENKLSSKLSCIANPVETAKNIIPALTPHCDVMILLTHLGYSLDATSALTADAGDVELAKQLPYAAVHLIVGGHSHHELNQQGLSPRNIINGIPIVQAGSLGRYLGRVDIRVKQKTSAVTNVRLTATETLPIDNTLESEVMSPLLRRAKDYFGRILGEVENDFQLSTDHVRNAFASGELSLANFITDGMLKQLRAAGQEVDFAMIDASCVRRGLDAGGKLTYGDWFNLMPFADTIRIYRITGEQLLALLQDNACRIDRPGEPNTERGFLQFSHEVRYKVLLGKVRGDAKISEVTIKDIPIEQLLISKFNVAATSFVRELAGNWESCCDQVDGCELIDIHTFDYYETDFFLRREMVKYITSHEGVTHSSGAHLDGRLKVEDDGKSDN